MLRFGIIGIGGYGAFLIDNINQASGKLGCKLVAAAEGRMDANQEQARKLSQQGVELFDDAGKMLQEMRGKLDAVYIATGIYCHAPLAVAAMEAGYHVHLEKPPAATVQEVDQMIAAAGRTGRCCLIGFQALHSDDVRFVQETLVSGRLGKVRRVTCLAGWPRGKSYYARNDWAGKLRKNGAWALDGPATNALAHYLANTLLFASDQAGELAVPQSVRAELYAAGPVESHNVAAMEIKTASGVDAYYLVGHCTQDVFDVVINVQAEKGSVAWVRGRDATVTCADGHKEVRAFDEGQVEKMIANFIEAIRANDPSVIRSSLPRTRNMVLALDAAHESSGRIHRVADRHTRWVKEDGDERVVLDGLDGFLKAAAAAHALLSDLSPAPAWAVKTQPFSTVGYKSFPARFGCE